MGLHPMLVYGEQASARILLAIGTARQRMFKRGRSVRRRGRRSNKHNHHDHNNDHDDNDNDNDNDDVAQIRVRWLDHQGRGPS